MRQNYDRAETSRLEMRIFLAQRGITIAIPSDVVTERRFKRGSSGTSVVRPDGSRPPCSCILSQGVSTYQPHTRYSSSFSGYYEPVTWRPLYNEVFSEGSLPSIEGFDAYMPSSVDATVVDEAVRRWYTKLADFRANIAADLATLLQTYNMVASRTAQIANAARQLRRGNLHGFADVLGIARPNERRNNFASSWLEYHYGWVPILSDIHELMSIETNRALRRRVIARYRREGVFTKEEINGTFKYATAANFTDVVTVSAMCELQNPARFTASQLGLTNPALLAWELLPYSFVVDWFVPIGPYFESCTARGDFIITDASVTRTRHVNLDRLTYSDEPRFINGKLKATGYAKNRTIGIPSMPIPAFRIPRFNITRLGNALALLSLQFRR